MRITSYGVSLDGRDRLEAIARHDPRDSPSARASAAPASGSPGCPRRAGCAADGGRPARGRCRCRPRATGTRRRLSRRATVASVSCSAEGLTGLTRKRGDRARSDARAPPATTGSRPGSAAPASRDAGSRSRARARPVRACAGRGSPGRTAGRRGPRRAPRAASAVAAGHPPALEQLVRMRRFVALSSTTSTLPPARSAPTMAAGATVAPATSASMRQAERAALAGDPGALGDERAVHELRQAAADGQAEARAAVPARDRGVGLAEGLEQPARCGPAGCRCRCRGPRPRGSTFAVAACGRQPAAETVSTTSPRLGELDRVGQEVEDDLAKAALRRRRSSAAGRRSMA